MIRRQPAEGSVRLVALHVRRGWRGPLALMPTATDDPLPLWCFLGCLGHKCDDLIPRLGLRQIELAFGIAQAEKMPVSLNEAGHRQAAFQLDDLGLGPDQRL